MAKDSEKRIAINKIFKELYDSSPNAVILKFDNNKVKEITGSNFRNQFDATKFGTFDSLPSLLKENGFFIIHLGQGNHAFIKGEGFHTFEEIKDIVKWPKSHSHLDQASESEAQSASTAFNDKIIHDFLFGDVNKKVLIHTARRARVSCNFTINRYDFMVKGLQIEMDGIYETENTIASVEVKNTEHKDFEIRQLFVAMKYFEMLKDKGTIPKEVKIRQLFLIRFKKRQENYFELYEYEFTDKSNPNSIKLVKCKRYNIS